MTTQIHELRNRLTTAVLTATAMLDGKMPPDKSNLQGLVRALEDVKSIIATVSKYDWDQTPADDQVVDVEELVRSVADELAMISSAGDVHLIVAGSDPRASRCDARGRGTGASRARERAAAPFVDKHCGGLWRRRSFDYDGARRLASRDGPLGRDRTGTREPRGAG